MTTGFTTAQHDKTSEPLPLDEEYLGTSLAQRIWIGNMDTKITEYTMVKILKNFGQIEQFDFLMHKSGLLQGQPRGYCFVSFEKEADAARAILKLNNMRVLSKRLHVHWAHKQPQEKPDPKDTLRLPSDNLKTRQSQRDSPRAQISALEFKLKEMEKTKALASAAPNEQSTSGRLHPLLALSKQNAAVREASRPYYKKKRRRR